MEALAPKQLRRFNKGTKRGFADVYKRLYRLLYFYAYKFLLDPEETEQIVSCVFTRLFTCVADGRRFESETSIKAFLFGECLQEAKARMNTSQYEYACNAGLFSAGEGNTNGEIIETEMMQVMYDVIEALPGNFRIVFKMYYLQELSCQQIAELLQLPAKTVLKRRAMAIKLIRKSILALPAMLSASLLTGGLAAILMLAPQQTKDPGLKERMEYRSLQLYYRCVGVFV